MGGAAWVVLIVAHAGLLGIFDLAASPVWTLSVLGLGFLAWAIAVRRLEGVAGAGLVLATAALLRGLVLPLPPTISDDLLRYAWDGRVVASGENPYLLAPESDRLTGLRDDAWRRMPHKEVPTVYPPLALGTFALASASPDPIYGTKILLAFADLGTCVLLLLLARRLDLAPGRTAWYAWNPLVVLEGAGQGHVDALMGVCVAATVYFLVSARPGRAGLAGAAGVLAKIVPLVALPLWARDAFDAGRLGGATRFVVAAMIALVAVLGPVAVSTGVPPGLVTYGVSWEWNGPIYEPLWRAFDHFDAPSAIKSRLDAVKIRTDEHEFWNRFYPYVYPQFLAKLVLFGGFGLFFLGELLRRRRLHPVATTERIFGAVILAMATVYPWYLLVVLPWAALRMRRAWLWLSALMPLAYLPQHVEGVELFPWIWAAIWIPFFVLFFFERSLFRAREEPHPREETTA